MSDASDRPTGIARYLTRFSRTSVAYAHDLAMAAVSFPLSLYLRLGDDMWRYIRPELLQGGTLLFIAVSAVVFSSVGRYRGIWRYASMDDLWAIARAVSVAVVVFVAILF